MRVIDWHDRHNIGPAGSINSTVSDLAVWLALQLAEGKYRDGRLTSTQSAREMHAPQTVIPGTPGDGSVYPKSYFNAYGLGWFVRDYRRRLLIEHSGSGNGFVAWVAIMPEQRLGLAILANQNETGINFALRHTILDAYLGEPQRDWSAAVKKDYQTGYQAALQKGRERFVSTRIKDTKPSLALKEYVGVYDSDLYGPIEIREASGQLRLRYGNRFAGTAVHWHFDTFLVAFENPMLDEWVITFELDVRGRAATLRAREMPWAPSYMDAADLGEFKHVTE